MTVSLAIPAPARTHALAIVAAGAFVAAAATAALAIGPVAIPPLRVLDILAHLGHDGSARDILIVRDIRLPRVLLGALVGAATAVAGAVMQGLFRNPIADPGIVGVSSGAALAAALWFVIGESIATPILTTFGLPIAALAGGLAVTAALHLIARRAGQTSVVTLALAGIAISALANAVIGILLFIANDQQLRAFTFWTLGSFGGATFSRVLMILPFIATFLLLAPMLARGLDALALGEPDAFHLGINVERLKRLALLGVAAAVGAAVAVSGIIGFVGLAVPHLVRVAIGPAHRPLLIVTALVGAGLMVITDLVARTIAAPAEVPIGVVTAALGAPFMLWLLLQRRGMPAA